MKLPKFLRRNKDDDEDDEDFDGEDFDDGFDDDEGDGLGGSTEVIDDDFDLHDSEADSGENDASDLGFDVLESDSDDAPSAGETGEEPSVSDGDDLDSLPPDNDDFSDHEDDLLDEEGGGSDDFDLDDDFPDPDDLDDDDLDFDDDGEDSDDEDDGGSRRTLIFIAAGVGVLALGIIGGAAFWFLGGDDEVAEADGSVKSAASGALSPPKGGGLNARAGNETVTTPETAGVTPAEPAAPTTSDPSTGGQVLNQALGGGSLNARAGSSTDTGQGLVVPATMVASFQATPNLPKASPLANAPDPGLLEKVEGAPGPLPKIGKDGRTAWQAYARPIDTRDTRPRVAIMITGLGLSAAATRAAIFKLPAAISLVFDPYAKDLKEWMIRARRAGHEAFIGLPMESNKFPTHDPGPLALDTGVQVAENMRRLNTVLGSVGGYVGVVTRMGGKFNNAESQLKPLLRSIKNRGLMFVDGGGNRRSAAMKIAAEIELPKAFVNVIIDGQPAKWIIDNNLRHLEAVIKERGTAIAEARPFPSSVNRIAAWAKTLDQKKLVLVPVSAVADKQFLE